MKIIYQARTEVVAESVSRQEKIFPQPMKVEELPVDSFPDLPTELILKLVPLLIAMRVLFFLRSPDVYDPLQICLQESGSQEIRSLIVQSAIDSVVLMDDVSQSVIGALIKLPSFIDLTQRPVLPLPSWSCDALVLL